MTGRDVQRPTMVAHDETYLVPVDPMDQLQCDSCQ